MENYHDLVSAIVAGAVMIGILIPLIAFLRHVKKEKDRLYGSGPAKDNETTR